MMDEREIRLECLKLAVVTADRRAITDNKNILDISAAFYDHVVKKGDQGLKQPSRQQRKKKGESDNSKEPSILS